MRVLPWILVGVLAVLAVAGWLRPRGAVTATACVTDTVTVRDTIRDTVPRYVSVATVRRDTLLVPMPADTVRDSIPVILPIGAITSFLGGPLFLYLLFRGGRQP